MLNAYNFNQVEPIDADDIIDVSVFDFTDNDTWLHVSANCPPEGNTLNLPNWLKNGATELDLEDNDGINGSRKSIDSRTFTRPKKRNNRMSFESIIEALSPPANNVWKKPSVPTLQDNNLHMENESSPTHNRRESVPAMLKTMPSPPVRSGLFGTSGQESMEAFLNLSQSKGIDSFINLTEPEFADTLMNVSQPSDLSSSLVDMTKDTFTHEPSILDSQILTDSMMKTSMFADVSDIKDFNEETFLKDIEDDTTLKKSNVFDDNTLSSISNSEGFGKPNLNSTFNTFTRKSAMSLPRQSLPLDIEKQTVNTTFTSSPYNNKSDLNGTLVKIKADHKKVPNGFNGTFLSQQQTLETINITLGLNHDLSEHLSDVDADIGSDFSSGENLNCNTTISHSTMNSTFIGPSDLRRELLEQVQRSTEQNLDSTYSHVPGDHSFDVVTVVNHNNTYKRNSSKSHVQSPIKLTSIALPTRQNNDRKYYTFTKKTNMTDSKTNIETQPSLEILDNTSCKPSINFTKKIDTTNIKANIESQPSLESLDSTYCKLSINFTNKTNTADSEVNIKSQPSLESLDDTFYKPSINYQKKLRTPRVLSKVPQLFQKSNPNLTSNSLKNFDNQQRSNIPNSKFGRGGQLHVPRNVEGSLINKLLPLGRLKSGSEQRLLEVGGSIKEFLSKGTCGSTESIESTQSAHSAPDLDDRLSVCSDSSHTSYNSRVINSAQLHYIARLQEESLKQISTPKPNRRVLENNWVDAEKGLPSPILKGGSQELQTVNRVVKTSSPLLSSVGSSAELVPSTGNHNNDVPSVTTYQGQNNLAKKPEMLVRPMKQSGLGNKTRLRAPTNWSAPNRTSGSGIPRPTSRIPGPRFSQASSDGNNQTDWKKGCL